MLRVTTTCAAALLALCATARAAEAVHSAELDEMIARQAKRHGVPEKLVRRIVVRESNYNPRARNHSFWGLMQISYPTARSMGFRGSPSELLDPVVNLTYAVPYLANAFVIAGRQEDAAVRLYAHGYYATAKNRNLLGQLRTAESEPLAPDEGFLTATARPVSNLITAVVSGPSAQQPTAGETVAASSVAPVAQASDGGGKGDGSDIAMVSGKKGLAPPPKWTRDGGVTLIGRGEQRIEQVAAYSPPSGDGKSARRVARGRSRKNTEFAALDAPPASAQAYAGSVPAPDGGPQAAIAQATSAPAAMPVATPDSVAPEVSAKSSRAKSVASRKIASSAQKTAARKDTADSSGASADADPDTIVEPVKKKPAPKKTRVATVKTAAHPTAIAKSEEQASPSPTQ